MCPGYTRTHIADGDRNRPQALQNEEPRSPSEERWIENIRRALAQGMEPEAVADCVLDAIRDSHFYVFPDEVWLEAVSHRFERVLSQRPPSWKIPDGALTP